MGKFIYTDAMASDGIESIYYADTISFAGLTQKPGFFSTTANLPPAGLFGYGQPYGDQFGATKIILSRFSDRLELRANDDGIKVIEGGAGADVLSSSPIGYAVTLDGGADDDILSGLSPLHDHLLGRTGSDWLIMVGGDEATGGTGADHFVIQHMFDGTDFITDLNAAPGKDHDVIDLYEVLKESGHSYASFSEAVAAGTLSVTYQHGYTYLWYHTGFAGLPEYQFARIKGVVTPDQYDSTFQTTYGTSYDALNHWGDDVLDGRLNPGRDQLRGDRGNDVLIMDGNDQASGQGGDTLFVLTQADGNSAFITDFGTGDHDRIDLWKPLHDHGLEFDSFTQTRDAGAVGINYQYGYTKLTFDLDGDHVAEHEIAHIKGIIDPDRLDTAFSVTFEDSWFHTIA
jgi:hypothetical protein